MICILRILIACFYVGLASVAVFFVLNGSWLEAGFGCTLAIFGYALWPKAKRDWNYL